MKFYEDDNKNPVSLLLVSYSSLLHLNTDTN